MTADTTIKLTPSQQTAASHRRGEMVVLASAGSGKTASLTRRCAELLLDPENPCEMEQLLVVTFTNEAAAEMRDRIRRQIRERAAAPSDPARQRYARRQAALMDAAQIMTLHAFCHAFVKNNFIICHADPAMRMLDEIEKKFLLRQAMIDIIRQHVVNPSPDSQTLINFYTYTCGARSESLLAILQPLLSNIENSPDPDQYIRQAMEYHAGPASKRAIWDFLREKVFAHVDVLQHAIDSLGGYKYGQPLQANLQQLSACMSNIIQAFDGGDPAEIKNAIAVGWPKLPSIRKPPAAAEVEFSFYRQNYYEPIRDALKTFMDNLKKRGDALTSTEQLERESRIAQSLIAVARDVNHHYSQLKADRHVMDFADLEHKTLAALRDESNGLLAALRQQIKHVLVDEYQDINPVQEALIDLLAGGSSSVQGDDRSRFMVGDVLQSIYGFRGAAPELLHGHYHRLDGPNSTGQSVKMRENFRTAEDLLNAINALLKRLLRQTDEIIFPRSVLASHHDEENAQDLAEPALAGRLPPQTASRLPSGSPTGAYATLMPLSTLPLPLPARREPTLLGPEGGRYKLTLTIIHNGTADSDHADDNSHREDDEGSLTLAAAEARAAGLSIKKIISSGGRISDKNGPRAVKLSDIVILMRSPRARAPQIVQQLAAMGIAAHAQLSTGFLDSPSVIQTLSLLRVLDNPRQDIELASTLVGIYGCVTLNELQTLRLAAHDPQMPLHAIIDAVADGTIRPAPGGIPAELHERLMQHIKRLQQWRQAISSEGIARGMATILDSAAVRPLLNGRPDGETELANLDLLLTRAMQFAEDGARGISRFLDFCEMLSDADEDISPAGTSQADAVRVMSIHASKGLEFPVVLLVGLGNKINQASSTAPLLADRHGRTAVSFVTQQDRHRIKTDRYDQLADYQRKSALHEEARLLYVAMTRARDQLLLFGAVPKSSLENYRHWATDPIYGTSLLRARMGPNRMLDLIAPTMLSPAADGPFAVECKPADELLTLPSNSVLVSDAGTVDPPVDDMADSDAISAAIDRITYQYPHRSDVPAAVSVSRLKKQQLPTGPSAGAILKAQPPADDPDAVAAAIDRGLAMHRFLQMVNLEALLKAAYGAAPAAAIRSQIHQLVSQKLMGEIDASAAAEMDVDALTWFVSTPVFKALATAPPSAVHREQTILWRVPAEQVADKLGLAPSQVASPPDSNPTGDTVMIRGVIDALIYNGGTPVIIDYKTDQPHHIENRLPAYEEQIKLYASAVRCLLDVAQIDGYLVFLTARKIHHRHFDSLHT